MTQDLAFDLCGERKRRRLKDRDGFLGYHKTEKGEKTVYTFE